MKTCRDPETGQEKRQDTRKGKMAVKIILHQIQLSLNYNRAKITDQPNQRKETGSKER